MVNAFLITNDDIIIADPEGEYFPLVQRLSGQTVRLSPTSPHHLNPMDINVAGILYESDKHRCVFVGIDENSLARFACERGVTDDLKKDASGSSKLYSFSLPPQEPKGQSGSVLALFESPVDILAHASIHEIGIVSEENGAGRLCGADRFF